MRLIAAFCSLAIMQGCIGSVPHPQPDLFDSKQFFHDDSTRLALSGYRLEKNVRFGDSSETSVEEKAAWLNDLRPFYEIDLQKPAFHGAFAIDSIFNTAGTWRIRYAALAPAQALQHVDILFSRNTNVPLSIEFRLHEKNMIYESVKLLRYVTDSGFLISGRQSIRLNDGISYAVGGRFIRD